MLPSAFNCLPLSLGVTPQGTLHQVDVYDANGNVGCSGTQGTDARAYLYDRENRIGQTWSQSYNNTYSLTANYGYDGNGNRVRADQMVAGPNGPVTDTFKEYSNFGGQVLAEYDHNGGTENWTDYIYANGRKIAMVPGQEHLLHIHGVLNGNWNELNWNLNPPAKADGTPYVVSAGDRLCFRQYNSSGIGGPIVAFTNGAWTAWQWADTNGALLNQFFPQQQWAQRCTDLSMNGASTGASIAWMTVSSDVLTAAGAFDIYYADMSITSADGTVIQVDLHPNGSTGFQNSGGNGWQEGSLQAGLETVTAGAGMNGGLSAATHYYLGDHLGTTQLEFGSGGWPIWQGEFAPFGQELDNQTTANHYKFTGKERDAESGLDYFGARYFGSNMGRFMSPDWSAKATPVPYAKLGNPQSLNLYSYVLNNPLRFIDPDGHYELNASNCGDNAKCQKKYDKAANKFENRREKNLNSKNESIRNAAASYGAKGEVNGVHVGFGDTKSGGNQRRS